jgi:hypothetical protein
MAKSPKPPNPYQQASAQQAAELGASMGSSIINNPNTYTPYGSQTYGLAGYETIYDAQGKAQYVPRYNQYQTLSPDQMVLMGYETGTQGNLGLTAMEQSAKMRDFLNQGINTAGMQGWQAAQAPGAVSRNFRQDQGATDRAGIENAMMASYRRQTDPQNRAQQAQLAARGMSPGSQGYGTWQQGQQDAQAEAARQAYLASGQESRAAQDAYNQVEQARNAATLQEYQMGSDYASNLNNLRQAQVQEAFALRNQPINEIMALLGGSGVTMPQFQPFSRQGINAAPIGQYIGQNYANQANAAAQFNQGLFGLAGNVVGGLGSGGFFGNPFG